MMLAWLILLPLLGGILAWFAGRSGPAAARGVALAALGADLALALAVWSKSPPAAAGTWLADFDLPWVPTLGISLHLGLDGISLVLILLTLVLGILAVGASWTEVSERVGFFHFSLLWTLAGIVGVFLALDLILFFLLWELMLVPMYLLIALWGHEDRVRAAIKFFLFTQGGGLLMLVAILALGVMAAPSTGVRRFDYFALLGHAPGGTAGWLLMLGFFLAFAVKLPAVPLHTWLPDAHTQAPTAGSVILAGLLLKTGAYGLLRFAVPLFPAQSHAFAPVAMALGVAGILYGGVLAFAQDDAKRLVAYTSVSHLGFVLLGIYAGNRLALQGVILQMLAHGLSTGGLFIVVGAVQERLHSRDLDRLGGLWASMPKLSAIGLFLALASLGLPGLGNFIGEFLVLLGAWAVAPAFAVAGASGMVVSVVYALALVQRAFHGPPRAAAADFSPGHLAVMAVMMAGLVWLGLYPQPVLDTAGPSLGTIATGPSGAP